LPEVKIIGAGNDLHADLLAHYDPTHLPKWC
jgi:hypothetical protein